MTASGWGTFEITLNIRWRGGMHYGGSHSSHVWPLQFNGKPREHTYEKRVSHTLNYTVDTSQGEWLPEPRRVLDEDIARIRRGY